MIAKRRSLVLPAGPPPERPLSGVMALLPQADLLAMTGVLQEPAWLGVLSAEGLGETEARVLGRGLMQPPSARRPLHPLLARGVAVHSFEVDSARSKDATVAAVALIAGSLGLRRRAVAQVEQAADEMLLNALYDAPVDAGGRPRYLDTPADERAALRAAPEERAVLRCAGDERRFVVAVRDRWGTLRRHTVLRYLRHCAEAQAARSPLLAEVKPGGAGVGLYLIASCASELIFRLRRGKLTDVVYAIDVAAGQRLRALVIDEDAGGAVQDG